MTHWPPVGCCILGAEQRPMQAEACSSMCIAVLGPESTRGCGQAAGLCWLPRTCSDCCMAHVIRVMLISASILQATKENSGLGANLKQQPGNKNPSKGSIVDESGQAGGECGSCVLNFQLTGKCLAPTVLTLCCMPAEAMAPGGLVPEVTNGEQLQPAMDLLHATIVAGPIVGVGPGIVTRKCRGSASVSALLLYLRHLSVSDCPELLPSRNLHQPPTALQGVQPCWACWQPLALSWPPRSPLLPRHRRHPCSLRPPL